MASEKQTAQPQPPVEIKMPDVMLREIVTAIKAVPTHGVSQRSLALASNSINEIEKAARKLKQDIVKQMVLNASQEHLKL